VWVGGWVGGWMGEQVKGVQLYITDFERPVTDRLKKDFFSDPTQVCQHLSIYIHTYIHTYIRRTSF
jgi:hypothetical protein